MDLYRLFESRELDTPRSLVLRWKQLSLAHCWRATGDWWTSETELAAEMISSDDELSETLAQQLGKSRAVNGVGVTESVHDFRLLYQAANRPVNLDSLQAFVEGWVTGWDPEPAISCTDPRTGLSTMAHLHRLVSDLLNSAEGSNRHLVAAFRFTQHPPSQGVKSWEFEALIGKICSQSLVAGGASFGYEQGVLLALINRTPENFTALLDLQVAFVEALGETTGSTNLEYDSLTKNVSETYSFLDSFRR